MGMKCKYAVAISDSITSKLLKVMEPEMEKADFYL